MNCCIRSRALRISLGRISAGLLGSMLAVGCTTRPPFMTNADPALRKSSAQFAADAAHRHYEADAPKGGFANGRAEVDYGIHRITIANSSNEDWDNVELWLNHEYVVFIPKVPANAARSESMNFQYIFDQHGNSFPTNSLETPINSVDLFMNGKMYSLGQPALAD